jgi:phosphoglucomutase
MSDLHKTLELVVGKGQLLATSAANILRSLAGTKNPIYRETIDELIGLEAWSELDDRFFKTLAFGTGGLRGRSIGKIITRAEAGGKPGEMCPEFPCVGTNCLNFYNISRATQGLVRYARRQGEKSGSRGKPSIAIAYDTRFFSRQFSEAAAKVALENGCDVFLFESARSTPELSFAVRHTNATAGIVITASHNPPHDNGFKVYFSDGAQVVEPHASGIIAEVNSVAGETYPVLPLEDQGKLVLIGAELDEIYKARLSTQLLRPDLVAGLKDFKIVFTPIHGTGAIISVPILRDLGFQVSTVPEQDEPDGAFPTVNSPNPENAAALALAIGLAEKQNADLVIGTDPDCDRMGIAIRDRAGKMKLLTGNQIGSLLAFYRIKALKEQGVITAENAARAVIIKTLVTSDLQKAIAEGEGLRCVETLTGFKYIGQKLGKYESGLPAEYRVRYRSLDEETTRKLRLESSSFYVFGGEESYGYSGGDFVRDKDGNDATLLVAEVAAYAKAKGVTLDELLDQIYLEYGYYLESGKSLIFEGAEGSEKIRILAESYNHQPPAEIDGAKVTAVKDFAAGGILDVENDELPKEKMTIFELEDARRIAVRPSGTEPKIKFYLFGKRSGVTAATLPKEKLELSAALDRLWTWIEADAKKRVA